MYTKQSKKMITFDILEILKDYSDADHRLSQKKIEQLLAEKYDMIVDRKSIKRNIMDLVDSGINIEWTEKTRMVICPETGENEEQIIYTDFYLQRDITDCEIQLLIDNILSADYISDYHRKELIRKLESLSSIYFRKHSTSIRSLSTNTSSNNQLFFTLDILHEAITKKCKVHFLYKKYHINEYHLSENHSEYTVTPYNTEIIDGKYMLQCFNSSSEECIFRIDYISEIQLIKNVKKSNYHFGSSSKQKSNIIVRFSTNENMINDFIDYFGVNSLSFTTDNNLIISVNTDEEKALSFALKHPIDVIIEAPRSLRTRALIIFQTSLEKYAG